MALTDRTLHVDFVFVVVVASRQCYALFDPAIFAHRHPRNHNGECVETKFPDDLDTTSLGLVTLKPPKEHCESLMDEMLTYLSEDGLPYVSSRFARSGRDPYRIHNQASW